MGQHKNDPAHPDRWRHGFLLDLPFKHGFPLRGISVSRSPRGCAGRVTSRVHISGSGALYAACESEGVRCGILLSAIGVNRDTPSVFSGTKRRGEAALTSRGPNWVVLRPSVVIGRG